MENQDKQDKLAQILKTAVTPGLQSSRDDAFTQNVMRQIHALEPSLQIPGFLWIAPVLLAAALGLVAVLGIQNEIKKEVIGIDDLLLADIPLETQSLLTPDPSFNILWSSPQGGFLR